MKTLLTYLILIFAIQHLYSQIEPEWVIRYSSPSDWDNSLGVVVDNTGSVYITGYIVYQGGGTDFITIKYSSDGIEQWVQTYDGTGGSDFATAITIDDFGNVYITGKSRGNGSDDYATIKYNTDGVQQWVRRYNGPGNKVDEPSAIAIDTSGNVFVTGRSDGIDFNQDYATIKYSSDGVELWVRRYDGIGNNSDNAHAIAADNHGNVYVTGESWIDNTSNIDCVTIKYSSSGDQVWLKRYNGPFSGSDYGHKIITDSLGNAYVTGGSQESGSLGAYLTIKYSTTGTELWVQRKVLPSYPTAITLDDRLNIYVTGGGGTVVKYTTTGNEVWSVTNVGSNGSIGVDQSGNVYVAGSIFVTGQSNNLRTIKYDSSGVLQWNSTYNGPGNGDDQAFALAVDQLGNVFITGYSTGVGTGRDITTIKYPGASEVYEPALNDKWISGETDTIKWTETDWVSVNIKCILNFETPIEEEIILAEGYPVVNSEFEWEIPDTLLSYRSKIIIENANNQVEKIESDIFRIKPYVLTRLNEDSTYYDYRKDRDQWGFSNTQADIWPQTWYNQFNYQGTDPFTNNLQYSQTQGDSTFGKSRSHYHPDWVSWVNTFGENACYFSAYNGMYKPTALAKWWATSNNWGGSCFGIAAANAIAFSYRAQFAQAFPTFPVFLNPVSVDSSNGVRFIVNELFTHQYGNPTQANDPSALAKTPNQTLNEIRQMLLEDTAQVRTLSIYNNGGSGAHTILAYGLKQDPVQKNLFRVQVYDNSNPNSNNPITIDTLANGGTGSWSTPDWAGWGGNGKIHLEILSIQYLNGATFPARSIQQSAFILPQNVLEINYPNDTQIRIIDNLGNITGYVNNLALNEIPGSLPQMIRNGSESPPYGYNLQPDNYSVVLNEFEEDTVNTFFFTGNKSFVYERSGALQTQTDRLFFDGGVSVTNPDAQSKNVKLLNLINETTQEKLTVLRSIELAQNDSVKIKNPDSNKVKLISYGTAKEYDLELNYVTENGIGRFGDFSIPLSANSSHTFVPVWTDLTNSELQVLVDVGNDGTIDDTISLVNQVTGIGDDQGSLLTPNSYNLAQNYPNPFNPTTKISWQSPVGSHQTLKVYDVLGNEVATLVDEFREAGRYEITFDASNLSSGIYFYRLQAGSFVETKKMILLR